jgi:hypothetical protein
MGRWLGPNGVVVHITRSPVAFLYPDWFNAAVGEDHQLKALGTIRPLRPFLLNIPV